MILDLAGLTATPRQAEKVVAHVMRRCRPSGDKASKLTSSAYCRSGTQRPPWSTGPSSGQCNAIKRCNPSRNRPKKGGAEGATLPNTNLRRHSEAGLALHTHVKWHWHTKNAVHLASGHERQAFAKPATARVAGPCHKRLSSQGSSNTMVEHP